MAAITGEGSTKCTVEWKDEVTRGLSVFQPQKRRKGIIFRPRSTLNLYNEVMNALNQEENNTVNTHPLPRACVIGKTLFRELG